MYQFLFIFFVYAFLGWCTEVSYAALVTGRFVNRGFLNGPWCPVYGFGVVIVLAFLEPLKSNLLLLFLSSVVLTSALEWATGFVLEKYFTRAGGITLTSPSTSTAIFVSGFPLPGVWPACS